MAARVEITKKYARAYGKASKKERGCLLDEVVAVTGWSRDNARRRVAQAAKPGPRPARTRKPRGRTFSYDATKILQRVWAFSGGQCGKYLAVSMPYLLGALERHGELVPGQRRYGTEVREELLSMSAATIDRYLAPVREKDPLRGMSATTPSPLLCGPTLRGEFCRTLNLTDMRTGWVFTRSIRNNAHLHVLAALTAAVETIPFEVTGLDFDNGSEFINHDVIDWAAGRKIFFTRSRPYRKNDQATIESKNNHLVRRHAFHWRYDTPDALTVLNRLWPVVNDRMNFLTPTKKPVGWKTSPTGRRTRVYDAPRTPFERLLHAGTLSPTQEAELTAYRDGLNPAEIARRIQSLQDRLTAIAKRPTLDLEASLATPAPDTTQGIRISRTG